MKPTLLHTAWVWCTLIWIGVANAADTTLFLTTNDVVLSDVAPDRDLVLRIRHPKAEGPHPVIVFSHGAMSSPARYDPLSEHWASQGYVVIAPTHLDSTVFGKVDPRQMGRIFDSRKSDMSLVLDLLAEIEDAVPELAGNIDDDRVAAAGHSMGALIAMAVTGLATKNSESVVELATDSRFDVAVLLSGPGAMPVIPDNAWGAYNATALLVTGTKDVSTFNRNNPAGWRWHLAAFEDTPPGGKFALIVDNLEHSLGGLICCNAPNQGPPDHQGLDIVNALTTLFLEAHLRGDDEAQALLTPEHVGEMWGARAVLRVK